jgi:hypothetical protein
MKSALHSSLGVFCAYLRNCCNYRASSWFIAGSVRNERCHDSNRARARR